MKVIQIKLNGKVNVGMPQQAQKIFIALIKRAAVKIAIAVNTNVFGLGIKNTPPRAKAIKIKLKLLGLKNAACIEPFSKPVIEAPKKNPNKANNAKMREQQSTIIKKASPVMLLAEKKIVEFMTEIVPQHNDCVEFICPENLLEQFIYDKTTFKLLE